MLDRSPEQARLIEDRRRADQDWASASEALREQVQVADPDLWRMIVGLEEAGNWRVHIAERVERVLGLSQPPREEAPVEPVADLNLVRVLAGVAPDDRTAFVEEIFGPLLRQHERKATELLETLNSLYRHGGRVADVADELHIHEKTVRYRLRNVQQLIDLRLDLPADRLQIDLALFLHRAAAAEPAD